jgi:uroporphyrinogen III methyltransferase/synthase
MEMKAPSKPSGIAYLVGAGPGDPTLLTLRGAELLRRADVVLYDYLVNPRILEHARAGAELVCMGRHGKGNRWTQEEINARMVADGLAGKTVVRLKGGDPVVFGHLGEEVAALRGAGISFEIVPGITAALAAGSYVGIPLTHRKHSSALAVVTGHEDPDKPGPALDYGLLATFPGTLVFYMGVTTIEQWTGQLIAAGKPGDTPVALVRRVSQAKQSVIKTTLASAAGDVVKYALRPPVVTIVGSVVDSGEDYDWFSLRPLHGKTVLVTRPRDQASELADRLSELGAEVLLQPVIEIRSVRDTSGLDTGISRLVDFDWVVFSSRNGVTHFMNRLLATGKDVRALGNCRIAAIGPGTADALAEYHLKADVLPEQYRAEDLADALAKEAAGKWMLLIRASRGREVLAERLTAAGAKVAQAVAYESIDVTAVNPDISAAMADGKIDFTTVTSSAIARSMVGLFGESLRKTKLVSISPVTSETIRQSGFEVALEAEEYTSDGLVQAILAQPE